MKVIEWKQIKGFDGYYIFIRQWNCISSIEKELGISITSIINCCSGRSKSAGKYKWRYENE